jgi:sulfonate transport system substrate-binding protein
MRTAFFALACLIFGMVGCTKEEAGSTTVRIGYQKTGTLNLVRLRKSLEPDLAKIGWKVEWIAFPAGPQLLEAMNAGSIDFGHTGDAPPILAQAAGVPFVYVAHEPGRPHAEAIIVPTNSPLRTLADLKGRKVALNKGSNVHCLLVRAVEKAGLTYDQIQPIFLPPSDARAAFDGGSVDAWAAWDPYYAEAELSSGAKLLADGEGLVANREFQLASSDFARKHPEPIRIVVDALRREAGWAQANPDEVAQIFATQTGLKIETMRRVIGRKRFGIAPMDDAIVLEQQKVADTFTALGVIPRKIEIRAALLDVGPTSERSASN